MNKIGQLSIVATPIGNLEDITLRALNVLREADVIVCEEYRQGSKLLKRLDIPHGELIALNEHNEAEMADEVLQHLYLGKNAALISDCGTPVFSDPGHRLIKKASEAGIRVIPIPGASSLMALLSVLDFKIERFVFGGFLPRATAERTAELRRLQAFQMPLILMDTPYRMEKLLKEVAELFGKNQRITLGCDFTLPSEHIYRGSVSSVLRQVQGTKREFMLLVHGPVRRGGAKGRRK